MAFRELSQDPEDQIDLKTARHTDGYLKGHPFRDVFRWKRSFSSSPRNFKIRHAFVIRS